MTFNTVEEMVASIGPIIHEMDINGIHYYLMKDGIYIDEGDPR